MAANFTSEKPILARCLDHLNEVFRISNDISDLMDTEEYSKMESLFTNRGQEIAILSELEQALSRLLLDSPDSIASHEIEQYKLKRKKLVYNIIDIDKKASFILTASKESVLSEMKELYQGKKMNDGYLNPQQFISTFIDTKE